MAQVGRISGPLLQENLERNGIDLAFETDLLYLDVNTGRIGVKNNSPTNAITVSGTTRINNFQVDSEADFSNLNFQNSTIEPLPGSLFLDAVSTITSTRINTDNIDIDNNVIKTFTPNSNLELRPNGIGKVDVYSNVLTQGNMHTTGNITVGGNIVFGDSDEDTVTFDSEITSDLVPDEDLVYNLGTSSKRWFQLNAENLNGEDIDTAVVTVQGLDLGVRQGNLYYVSVNGDNSNDGDHQQSPFRTIDYAVTQASAGDTIYVYPGEYEETTPIVIPKGVSVIGHDMRNTVVSPPSSANSNDIFWVNGEVTVENLTVKDFFYDDVNDTGYAFRFAPNTEISSRSPYIKNVSVITSGSNITPEDPRGFGSGDAGKGALVDGVEVLDSSTGASMLFHAVTFITPGVDALTMTNGVRVEWLNSFTYFANRGLYAKNGVDGWLSTDGSTVRYGAELRSIGSANVYGNFGAVADGADTLMYLIMHNFAYIGSGKDVTNDTSLVLENQQTVESNSGTIYYQSTDQLGKFKVGDNFFVDFETGSTSVNIDSLTADSLSGLVVSTNGSETFITGNKIETGNIRFTNNSTLSLTGDYNVNSASGNINLNKSTNIQNNLDITGDFTFDGAISFVGNEPEDTVTFNVELEQDFNPNDTMTFDLGSTNKQWLTAFLNKVEPGDITVYDNRISTKTSNADLELRANGTGKIVVPDNSVLVSGISVGNVSNFEDVDITGSLNLVGDLTVTNDKTVNKDLTISQNIAIDSFVNFEEITINGNFISTTTSNADLELRANGVGEIVTDQPVVIDQNLSFNDAAIGNNLTADNNLSADNANVSNVEINNSYIETASLNEDLELKSTKNISVPLNDVDINQNLTVTGISDLQDVSITGILTHNGVKSQTGDYDIAGELFVDDIQFEDNFITSTGVNQDLVLIADNNVIVNISTNNVQVNNNLTSGTKTNLQNTAITGAITHTGSRTQTGGYNQTGNTVVNGTIAFDRLAQLENIQINGNVLQTTDSNSNLELGASGTGRVVFDDSVKVSKNLFAASIASNDIVIDQDLKLNEIVIPPSIIEIDDNFISTKISNADLELRANGSGIVVVPLNDVTVENNLDVNGTTTLKNTLINNTVIHTGTRLQTGDYTQTGNLVASGVATIFSAATINNVYVNDNKINTTTGNLVLGASSTGDVVFENLQAAQDFSSGTLTTGNININGTFALEELESSTDIKIFDNVITTTNSNSNLELRANGIGDVALQDLKFNQSVIKTDLTDITLSPANNVLINSTGALRIPVGTTDEILLAEIITTTLDGGTSDTTSQDILDGGNALTTFSNSITYDGDDAEGEPNPDPGTLRFNSEELLYQGFNGGTVSFNGVYSDNRLTSVTAHPTNNTVDFTVNGISAGTVDNQEFSMNGLQVENININNNTITTNVSNSDLELRTGNTGELAIDNLSLVDNQIKNNGSNIVIANTGRGYVKIDSVGAATVPTGTVSERPVTDPEVGDTRFNTDDEVLEVWDGSTYIAAAGTSSAISESEFSDLIFEYTLIFG